MPKQKHNKVWTAEKDYFMRLLADNGWNHNAIAEMLDMNLQQVKSHACYKKIKIKRPPSKKNREKARKKTLIIIMIPERKIKINEIV